MPRILISNKMITRIKNRLINKINQRVKKTNWYNNKLADISQFPTNTWYRSNFERQYDMVNIGSSNAVFAFDYEGQGIKALNWSGRPQSLELGFKLLKNFFSILKQDGIFLIPLGPFTGLKAPWTGQKEEERYFGIMHQYLFEDFTKIFKEMYNPFLSHPRTVLKKIIKDSKKLDRRNYIQLEKEIDYIQNAQEWIANWKDEFGIDDLEKLSPHLQNQLEYKNNLLQEIIAFCRVRNIRPVLLIPPVHSSLRKYFNKAFKEIYMFPLQKVAIDNGVQIIDMMDLNDFTTGHFYNSYFLNKKGSAKFMEELLKKIN